MHLDFGSLVTLLINYNYNKINKQQLLTGPSTNEVQSSQKSTDFLSSHKC